MHVITANKGPVVHAYKQLSELAELKDRKFFFESTVMDGAPIFSLFREALPGSNLISFRGILNSTTNMILTRMEDGESFDDAVAYCQKIGIAETDPRRRRRWMGCCGQSCRFSHSFNGGTTEAY